MLTVRPAIVSHDSDTIEVVLSVWVDDQSVQRVVAVDRFDIALADATLSGTTGYAELRPGTLDRRRLPLEVRAFGNRDAALGKAGPVFPSPGTAPIPGAIPLPASAISVNSDPALRRINLQLTSARRAIENVDRRSAELLVRQREVSDRLRHLTVLTTLIAAAAALLVAAHSHWWAAGVGTLAVVVPFVSLVRIRMRARHLQEVRTQLGRERGTALDAEGAAMDRLRDAGLPPGLLVRRARCNCAHPDGEPR